jgi:hypothetical protein
VVERWTRAPGATTGTIDERPAVVISLAPASGDPAAGHDHGAAAGQPTGVAAPASAPADNGTSPYIKWVLVVLVLLGGLTVFSLYRQRRIPAASTDEKDPDKKELVSNSP